MDYENVEDNSPPATRFTSPNCSVCLQELIIAGDQPILASTFCGHVYHQDCLMRWLPQNATCPECREEVYEDDFHSIYLGFEKDENPVVIAPEPVLVVDSLAEEVADLMKRSSKIGPELEKMSAGKLRKYCEFLMKKNQMDKVKAEEARDKDAVEANDKLKMMVAKLKQRHFSHTRRVETLEREAADDRELLKERCHRSNDRVSDLETDNNKLEREIKSLRELVESMRECTECMAFQEQMDRTQHMHAKDQAELACLRTQVALDTGTYAELAAADKKRIDRLPDQPYELRKELAALQVSINMHVRSINGLKRKYAVCKQERDVAEQAAQSWKRKYDKLRKTCELSDVSRRVMATRQDSGCASDSNQSTFAFVTQGAPLTASSRVVSSRVASSRIVSSSSSRKRACSSLEKAASIRNKIKPGSLLGKRTTATFANVAVQPIEEDKAMYIKHGLNAFGERQAFIVHKDFPLNRG